MRFNFAFVVAAVLAPWLHFTANGEEKSPAELLPPSTAVYAEITQPKVLLTLVLEHPLRARIEESEQYQQLYLEPNFLAFRLALAAFEDAIDMKWHEALGTITEGGATLAADPATGGVVLISKSGDERTLAKVVGALAAVAERQARESGGEGPKTGEYRGARAWRLGEARVAVSGTWLIVTNKEELGKAVIDRLHEGGPSLADSERFRAAHKAREAATLWSYIDVTGLREAGAAKQVLGDRIDNPVAELLLGGVLEALGNAPSGTLSLNVERDALRLSGSVPFDPAAAGERREYFFGKDGGGAPPLLRPKMMLFSASAYRDAAGMWRHKDDIFDESTAAGLEQADGQFTTLFSGLDFGEEVLGALAPEVQIVAARQDFEKLETPAPEIKLPAGAIVFRLREPDAMQLRLKVAFQSLIGFLNVAGAQQAQPQLDMNTEKSDDGLLVSATYVVGKDETEGKINYNVSPALAFVGDRMILSTTTPLARELMAQVTAEGGDAPAANTRVELDVQVLRAVLADNREPLVAQNMVEKGHGREEAEGEVNLLLELIGLAKGASVELKRGDGKITISAEVTLSQ